MTTEPEAFAHIPQRCRAVEMVALHACEADDHVAETDDCSMVAAPLADASPSLAIRDAESIGNDASCPHRRRRPLLDL